MLHTHTAAACLLTIALATHIAASESQDSITAAPTALPSIDGLTYQWSDFGIQEHVFTGRWNNHTYRAVIYLRLLCTDNPQQQLARFVITLNDADVAHLDNKNYHAVTPKTFLDADSHLPEIYLKPVAVNGRSDSRVTVDQRYWKDLLIYEWQATAYTAKTTLNASSWYTLHMQGSEFSMPVRTFECSETHQLFNGSSVWLGMVERMVKDVDLENRANVHDKEIFRFMLMDHLQYHLKLGIKGTMLVCTPETAAQLLMNSTVKAAVEAQQLVLVTWEGPLMRDHPLIMQGPANNLLKLAMAGSDSTLGLWDIDEYLVLPGKKPISYEVTKGCLKRLQDPAEHEQVIGFSLTLDSSFNSPEIHRWLEHGGMMEAVKNMNYTSQAYHHCKWGILCKALINPNSENSMHVHQLVRPPPESNDRTPTQHDCAYIHHFWQLWKVRGFWLSDALGQAQPLDVSELPQ